MQQRGGAEGRDSLFSTDFMGGFPGFALFGSNRSMMPNLFGERDPFDDPFFTRPFGSMFESSLSGSNGAKGLVIQEISSDQEREEVDRNENGSGSGKEPSVEHPDERRIMTRRGSEDSSFGVEPKATSRASMHTCKVTYGGVNGAYYTSTRTRRVDNEGVLLEVTKEANKTTGQATHRISRGIHDKGHSVTRKLNPDGEVDILQTLHNLNEEELPGFDQAWESNFQGHKNVPKGGFHMDSNAESSGGSRNSEMTSWAFPYFADRRYEHNGAKSSSTKKVIRINIE